MILENKKYLSFAHSLANKVGNILKKNYKTNGIIIDLKKVKNKQEVVTNIDLEIEELLRKLITSKFPTHNILGEEKGFLDNKSDFTWIIDPIDGTKAFAAGIPLFGLMISLKYKECYILGLVDQPILKERYWSLGKSSFLNKKKINTSNTKKLSDATLAITDPNMFKNFSKINQGIFKKFNYVRWGTDVMGYLRCAEGIIDAIIERDIKIWDLAAVVPIIKNAGGFISTWEGKAIGTNDTVCAACNETIHKILLKNLQNYL